MAAIHYEEYRNPMPSEISSEDLTMVLDYDPDLTVGYSEPESLYPMRLSEYLLRALRGRSDLPVGIKDWQNAATSWLPDPLMVWWLRQINANPWMESNDNEWWQTQPRVVVAAWYDDRPVGAVGLAQVTYHDRELDSDYASQLNWPLFNEMRGLIVERQLRRSEFAIGRSLVQRIVEAGRTLQTDGHYAKATVAVTTNPVAARLFESTGAVGNPLATGIAMTEMAAQRVMCWQNWIRHMPPIGSLCDECPRRPGRLWLWSASPRVEA